MAAAFPLHVRHLSDFAAWIRAYGSDIPSGYLQVVNFERRQLACISLFLFSDFSSPPPFFFHSSIPFPFFFTRGRMFFSPLSFSPPLQNNTPVMACFPLFISCRGEG